jgi:hypothetical protein
MQIVRRRVFVVLAALVISSAAAAQDVVCRQCTPTRASEMVFASPKKFPTDATFGVDGHSTIDPRQAFIVRLPPKTALFVTTSHEAEFRSEVVVYQMDTSASVLALIKKWESTSNETSVYISNPSSTKDLLLLLAAWEELRVAQTNGISFQYSQDTVKILTRWANSASIGADDSSADGDFNDIVINLVCADSLLQPPPTVRKITVD